MMDTCIEWKHGRDGQGYGVDQQDLAHLRAYRKHKGPVPAGLEVMHLCNNKACINPDHLLAVTHQVNTAYTYYCGRVRTSNTSRCTGVERYSKASWQAAYTQNGYRHVLYRGKSYEEACKARKAWEALQLKRFPREVQDFYANR